MSAPDMHRVLVVEDDFFVADLLVEMLTELGYEAIGPVGKLDSALEIIQNEVLDAAILDINLKGQPVYPVAERCVERRIPVVFSTGYSDSSLMPECFRALPNIVKPFSMEALRSSLIAALAASTAQER